MSLLTKPPASPAGPTSLPWPATIIVIVIVIAATALFLTGHTAAAALGLAGVEVVQRLATALRGVQ